MAFDRSNPTHLATLKSLVADPTLGTQEILDSLNLEENNPGAETGAPALLASTLLSIVFNENIASQDQFKIQLLFEATNGLMGDVSDYRLQLIALSAGLSNAINALSRHLSIAEVNFANVDANGVMETVIISRDDWFAARDS